MSEAALQAAVAQYLAVALPRFAVQHHSPGEGKRGPLARAQLVQSGFCTGWPDLEIVWRGRVIFIELKQARGSLRQSQRETHRRLLEAGAPLMVCRSLAEVEAGLRGLQLPLRARVAA